MRALLLQKFWRWYEKYYVHTVGISALLFALQLIHLLWLTGDVVAVRLGGHPFFHPTGIWELLIVVVDYLEIPTLLSISLIYINELRKRWNIRSLLFLLLLNSQWLHLFWITDEVVEEILLGDGSTVLPFWAAWVAILIDYLEVPVIVDTVYKFIKAMRERRVQKFIREEFVEEK